MDYVVSHYGLTMRRACRLVKQPRSVQYYRSVKDPRPELRARMREIAHTRVRYAYRRRFLILRRPRQHHHHAQQVVRPALATHQVENGLTPGWT